MIKPWKVVSQRSWLPDQDECAHRFEIIADLCAVRRAARNARETGVFYTVRKAAS